MRTTGCHEARQRERKWVNERATHTHMPRKYSAAPTATRLTLYCQRQVGAAPQAAGCFHDTKYLRERENACEGGMMEGRGS
jgi:hypothetical protein